MVYVGKTDSPIVQILAQAYMYNGIGKTDSPIVQTLAQAYIMV